MTTVKHIVVIDYVMPECFNLKRGLRQGDLLSRYLFLLCSEGLSSILTKFLNDGRLSCIYACTNGPNVSYMFFLQMIVCFSLKQTRPNAMSLLKMYEEGSGQKINFEKSGLFFSPITSRDDREIVKNIFGI